MQSLVDELKAELAADQGLPHRCGTCRWIESLPQAQQPAWDTVLSDRAYSHVSIYRAIARRTGQKVPLPSKGSIENHRSLRHRQTAKS